MSRTYSADERTRALALYVSEGPKEASRQTGISANTISSWAKREGLSTRVTSTAQAATDAARAKAEERRTKLAELFLEKAIDMLERLDQPHIDFRGKDAEQVEFPKPTATACREYAVAAGILIDKYRLEMGEDTDRRKVSADVTLRQVPDDQLSDALARVLKKLDEG